MNCFETHKIADLTEVFKGRLKEGMSEHEIKMEGLKLAQEYHASLHGEMESLKKEINPKYKTTKLLIPDNSQKIADINSEYESKIKEQAVVPNPTEGDMTGITHAQMNETAKEFGLSEYEGSPETHELWNKQADERFKKDPEAMTKLLNKMRDGGQPDAVEQKMMAKYIADLKAKVRVNPSDELLTQLKRAKDLSNIVGGRDVAKSLVARKGDLPVEETLPDYLVREMEVNKVDKLTEEQKKNVTKEFVNIDETQKELNDKVAKLEAENIRLKAEKAVKKISSETNKVKKSHEDFVKERKSYIVELKELKAKAEQKLKDKGIQTMGVNFTFNGDMAKVVGKMVKSLVEEGVEKLEDIVKNIHGQLKDVFEGMEEKDVHDIIAGAYNEKKSTRNELAARVVDVKKQAALINKLEKLKKGGEPKTEKQKISVNKEVAALQEQIKDFNKENPDVSAQLKALRTRSESELKKVEEQIKKGDFGPDEKNVPLLENKEIEKKEPKLFKEALDAKDKLVKAKIDRHVRLLKQEYENRSGKEKAFDAVVEVANVPRTIMSSMDFSAPMRQGLVPTVSHPLLAAKAAATMFEHAFSQKAFDRWFISLRESKEFKVMDESGLYVADPHDLRLTVKEEAFMNNLAEKIPVIGKLIKGSERAYVSYLNKMRVDLFKQGQQLLLDQGKTISNSKKEYEGLARWVNTATGRGDLGKTLDTAAPVLNSLFFSPRLIASRINALNPVYYAKLPKEVRIMALKDMGKLIAFGTSVMALSSLAGAKVETDPRSTDFGKIVFGHTRYDIWGGFQQYIRLAAQVLSGEKKNISTGQIKELNGKGAFGESKADVVERFARGKLAPVPSMTWDFLSGRTTVGDKADIGSEALQHFTPLIYSDVKDAWKDQGFKALFTVGIPSIFGVGVQTYQPKPSSNKRATRR